MYFVVLKFDSVHVAYSNSGINSADGFLRKQHFCLKQLILHNFVLSKNNSLKQKFHW